MEPGKIQGTGHDKFFDGIEPEYFPKQLHRLLQEASLLYHVPYVYLLPDAGLIGEDEIRFFQVDHNWITALLDGICSVGRNASIDYSHDTRWIFREYEEALLTSSQVRKEKLGEADETVREDTLPAVTGFLLNSVIAEQYRGLEFKAYDRETAAADGGGDGHADGVRGAGGEAGSAQEEHGTGQLPAIRIEKLGKRLLLGLFYGVVKRLEICQPPEGLHYGCLIKNQQLVKRLRSLKTGELLEQKTIDIPLKPGLKERILDIVNTAARLPKPPDLLRAVSSEVAVQMIQNAQRVTFTITREEKDDAGGGA